ncbi:MBL fold metallo-hydrolase [Methanocaldococcus infernus]|uniref:Beta-lactamase domain-containing protein n=1 Tax=Methanocaldococcus infernus (strain DSM 11812 / JCM 15783 / ME) TaxID=573063 RepID=D5VQC8_METIM|nr:MBL fold metallo-hydrolase [Methanocaldococcus infernus]ADG12781.1 beta-lactamase domain-containing protein [Methanocaldococcus infernus ME]
MNVEIIFLGSGGGRWATITQKKPTGGFRIHTDELKLHVDPGPGAIVRLNQLKISPWKTNSLFISHCHPDHYNDGEIIVEAITNGMTRKRGIFIGSLTVVEGFGEYEYVISKYHQSKLELVKALYPNDELKLYDTTIKATKTKHGDPFGIGFRLKTKYGDIGYTSDTEFIPSLIKDFDGVRVLIANIVRKKNEKIRGHLCSNDVIDLINSMENKPELLIMNHMGVKMTNPLKEAKYIEENTNIKVVPAKLGLRIELLKNNILIR